MQRALSGSIRTRGWSIFWNRRQANALRLLATGFRRLVKKRRRRRHAGELGIQQPPRTAQRRDWFRSYADRRVESQRHQRRRGAIARRVVHGGGARGGYQTFGVDGRRTPNFSSTRVVSQASCEYRSHRGRRTALAQCGFVVVGRRSKKIRRRI